MIPIRFFWLFDLLILLIAFWGAYYLPPVVHSIYVMGGPPWVQLFSPASIVKLTLPPFFDWFYIYFIMTPISWWSWVSWVITAQFFNSPGQESSWGALWPPLIAFSPITIVGYALKDTGLSRLFVFSFIGFSFLGLMSYRFLLRQYFIPRQAAGKYAKNVVFIGLNNSIKWMVRFF